MSDEEARVETSPQSPSAPARTQPPSLPDAGLLEALKRGDRAAASALLVDQHAAAIGRVCMALLGSQSEAEDALQDTLIAALGGLETFRGDGTLRAWLLTIARRGCARRLTARSRERDLREGLTAVATLVGPSTEWPSMARRARRLLDEIRPSEREALVLRFAAELSFRELGTVLGIDEAAARKRVSRGLARMRALLGEEKS